MGNPKQTLFQRLERNSIPEPNSGCLLWTGAVDHSGHGVITIWDDEYEKSITTSPHRIAWQLHRGPIPERMLVCHKCDVPSCINPDHLWLGTNDENMADMVAKGRAAKPKGTKHPNSKLTDDDIRAIRRSLKSGVDVAREYGISTANVSLIRSRKAWPHVEG